MTTIMERIKLEYGIFLADRMIRKNLFLSLVMFAVSMCLASWSQSYVKDVGGALAPDLILDRIPAYDVSALFFWGIIVLAAIPILMCMHSPKKIPFVLEATALFFIVRSFFVILTHLAPPSIEHYHYLGNHIAGHESLFYATSGYDMFFSGHAGYPFLLALLAWGNPLMRVIMLVLSAFMSAVVLLGHLHYSIDVFAAYFITFCVFEMAKNFFREEYALVRELKHEVKNEL